MPKDVSTDISFIKIPNKGELQQVALSHLSETESKDFIKIHKKCTTEPYPFLVGDATLPLDNPVTFRKIFLKQIYNKTMTIHDQIRDEKLPCDINIKAAQISALPSGKVYKCKYVTGEEILPSNQNQVIEQTKFT